MIIDRRFHQPSTQMGSLVASLLLFLFLVLSIAAAPASSASSVNVKQQTTVSAYLRGAPVAAYAETQPR